MRAPAGRRYAAAAAAAALAVALSGSPPPAAGAAAPIRVALEAGGTLAWALRVMQLTGIDRRDHLAIEAIPFATKSAAETALRGRAVDVKVDDWLFVSWARAEGLRVQAVDAFSRAVGGVVVRAGSPMRTIADLRGRRIAVTGLADKSYLVLRAVAAGRFGFDPQRDSTVISAAPPLLNRLLDRGDADAIVQYWQFIPELVDTGRFRELVSTTALVRRVAPDADLPFLVVAASDDAVRSRPDALRTFLHALRESNAQLASRQDLWETLFDEGRLGIPDRAAIPGLMARYRRAAAGPWTRATIDGLSRLTAALVAVAGPEIIGLSHMDPAAYNLGLAGPP
jgi:NitT/TauT family transport system substrate-binding protein